MTKARLSRSSSADPQTSKSATKVLPARDNPKPQYLFECWAKIDRRVRRARHIVVFLDFDGTLVRLRRNPKEVFLEKPARRVLRGLVRHRQVTLCLISGRQLGDLQQRVRVEGALYFGLHGWERSNGQTPDLPGTRRLRKEMRWVRQQVRGIPGIKMQDKGICFGIHYRLARKPAVEKAQALAEEVLDHLGPGFSLMAGKKIWEIYPTDMGNKGKAAKELLQQIPGRKLAIFAGDDTTDETAFALLRKDVTIRVGKFHETKANFFLRNPAEVLIFLEKLEETLS
ncbi:MAG TPA: trehalose-phosphatase [Terriglobia bacterium]|nr:trehalose-phosphatase [Terriglobia bacterium]